MSSGGCGKPGHVTEEVVDVISQGLDAEHEHMRQLFERVYNEALDFAAREADKVAACNHEPDEADECPAGCHHSGAADVAARIRALKAQKAPH